MKSIYEQFIAPFRVIKQRPAPALPSGGRPEPTAEDGVPKSELQALLRNVRYRTDQMTAVEYGAVSGVLMAMAPCRLLVFGLGRDSELWTEINGGGQTVFLENDEGWFRQPNGGVAYLVNYPGLVFPPQLASNLFDVALVDGPSGYRPEDPGRSESIQCAMERVRSGGLIILHDYNRPAEQRFAREFLGKPAYLFDRMAVFRRAP